MRVIITRTPDVAAELIESLRGGAQRAHLGQLKIACAPIYQAVALTKSLSDSHLADAHNYRWVTFTSANGVKAAEVGARMLAGDSAKTETGATTGDLARLLRGVKVACVGAATQKTLEQYGVRVDFVPTVADALHMVAEWPEKAGTGGTVLCVQGDHARDTLSRGLTELGWQVESETVYTMRPYPAHNPLVPVGTTPEGVDLLSLEQAQEQLHDTNLIIATAPSLLRALVAEAGSNLPPVVAIGATTKSAAQELELTVIAAASPRASDLADTALELLTSNPRQNLT
ncbi:uroporphyrinogen-III synthase [Rothia sp. ZJ932]|uniref:uroporphyrinogen-III synthase n=1 Tax=Rothia sp. ZJ932 TaxID=2810516 RepID=UPI001967F5B0|nr:uroporphyrinogen-III synthase [Rothia sp. ZJ932]QRZ62221.1 uroporphyrinogen-III synthase [Rothia sp. ZJ932]